MNPKVIVALLLLLVVVGGLTYWWFFMRSEKVPVQVTGPGPAPVSGSSPVRAPVPVPVPVPAPAPLQLSGRSYYVEVTDGEYEMIEFTTNNTGKTYSYPSNSNLQTFTYVVNGSDIVMTLDTMRISMTLVYKSDDTLSFSFLTFRRYTPGSIVPGPAPPPVRLAGRSYAYTPPTVMNPDTYVIQFIDNSNARYHTIEINTGRIKETVNSTYVIDVNTVTLSYQNGFMTMGYHRNCDCLIGAGNVMYTRYFGQVGAPGPSPM